jgi:hypothetical protein
MGTTFWIRRFFLVFASALAIITGAQVLKGHTLGYSVTEGLLWAAVASTIFTGARIYQSRRGQHCAICRDTPETAARAGEAGSEHSSMPPTASPPTASLSDD